MINRRSLITGLISLVAAPSVKIIGTVPVTVHGVMPNGIHYGFRGSFTAEDQIRFYSRLKLYMDEVVVIGEENE